jgi:RNA polymerase sigma-70 factor (ECF subfamily)
MDLADFRAALSHLSADQREALILVGAEGFSYEEVAEICACPVGTVKSRVNRARVRLADLIDVAGQEGLAVEGPASSATARVAETVGS